MMKDRHLNLFYTYHRDNQLIEDNLTRAWIVTLRFLSAPGRNFFLNELLLQSARQRPGFAPERTFDFSTAELALQGHIAPATVASLPDKYVVTIASALLDLPDEDDEEHPSATEHVTTIERGARPDAWIYSEQEGYCFLVEAKVRGNPLNNAQLRNHVWEWFDWDSLHRARLFSLRWPTVMAIANHLQKNRRECSPSLNSQERFFLGGLSEFISFFGYRLFTGIDFDSLGESPAFDLTSVEQSIEDSKLPSCNLLRRPPSFRFFS